MRQNTVKSQLTQQLICYLTQVQIAKVTGDLWTTPAAALMAGIAFSVAQYGILCHILSCKLIWFYWLYQSWASLDWWRIWPKYACFNSSRAETPQDFGKIHWGVFTCIVWSMCQCRQARAIHQKNLNKTLLPHWKTEFHLNHIHRKKKMSIFDRIFHQEKKKVQRCLSAFISSVILRSYGSRFLVISWVSSQAASFMMSHCNAPGIGTPQI